MISIFEETICDRLWYLCTIGGKVSEPFGISTTGKILCVQMKPYLNCLGEMHNGVYETKLIENKLLLLLH